MSVSNRGRAGGHQIKVNGRLVNVHLARIVYRCGVCLGGLQLQDFGLVCAANPDHRGLIHQSKAEAIAARQQENVNELGSVYEIVGGKVTIKCQS